MTNQGKELYEFGPFRLDPEKRLLLRDDEPVPLQLKAFETLLVLVRNRQQVVLKEELMQAVWPDTFVEESNLAQNIFVLRKTLAANSGVQGTQRYIATIPGRGYRFAEEVRVVSGHDALVVQRHSRTHVLIEEQVAAEPQTKVAVAQQTRPQTASRARPFRVALAAPAILALLVLAFLLRPPLAPPRVIGIHQITRLGTLVHNTHLITDGPRVYFRLWQGKNRVLSSVSTEGGDVSSVEMPFAAMDIDDIAPNSSEFLVENHTDIGKAPDSSGLWRVPVPSGSPRPTAIRTHEATWSPDGRSIAYALGPALYQSNIDGTNSSWIASLPGDPIYLRWSPDGQHVRFSAGEGKGPGFVLWQADLATHSATKLIPNLPSSARPWSGGWTPDGKYFFYTAISGGTRNLYAIREKSDFFHRTNSPPIQLTNGPFTFYLPLPAKDGKRLFVVGEQLRGQLIRYDAATQQFVPDAQPMSIDQIAYSPDGKWKAYIEFPEGTLVRTRADGSDRRQLTYPPMRTFNPQWSPDGTQIVFHAITDNGAHSKIYLVSPDGGVPTIAVPSDNRQTYASWTSDGSAILFSNSYDAQTNLDLRRLDLKTKEVSILPGTEGLMFGQISPDGRNVIAVERASRILFLYDIATHTKRKLAENADYPRWSRDGKFVYYDNLYFSATGTRGGVCRWSASTDKVDTLAKYPDYLLAGVDGVTFTLTPDGGILLLKDVSNRDLYSLDLDLP
jgi:DNA-binding winged helix-turn-helix (wHTH) protein/Tol biopolymer transport system component